MNEKPVVPPLHKRIALHPMTVLVLLCLGVFMVGSTFKASADAVTVTAAVHAQSPTKPAAITSFANRQHTTSVAGQVSGTCPADTYTKIYRNDQLAGVAPCDTTLSFNAQVSFAPGANQLQARVYNITDDEGPQSPPVTVFYDHVTVTPQQPAQSPTTLSVSAVDTASYQSGTARPASNYPTFSGFAPAFSQVVVTVHSDPVECRTVADVHGWWSCTLDQALPSGSHTVDITATTLDARTLHLPSFVIHVAATTPSLVRPAPAAPLVIHATYRYQTHYQGELWNWDISVEGGAAPYKVAIDWGDGTTSSRDRDGPDLFTISHNYKDAGTYRPTVRVVDAGGASDITSILQLLAIVKPSNGVPIATVTTPSSGITSYLWLIWPVYLAIVLMVLSFWLGEQEFARKIRLRHR